MTEFYGRPQFRGGVLLSEISPPATPAPGTLALFAGTDGYLYYKNDAGTVIGLPPPPQYGIYQTDISDLTTSYAYRTGMPSLSVNVPNSGRVECTWGLVGRKDTSSAASQIWVDVRFSGNNSRTPSDTNQGAAVYGQGNTGVMSVEKSNLFEGLTPGSTTMRLEAHIENTSGEHHLYESWLLVQVYP